jgi:hypothetical protein
MRFDVGIDFLKKGVGSPLHTMPAKVAEFYADHGYLLPSSVRMDDMVVEKGEPTTMYRADEIVPNGAFRDASVVQVKLVFAAA